MCLKVMHTLVEFFRAHGFKNEQISTLTVRRPMSHFLNAHKIFKPKLKFLKSLGLSDLEIAKLISTAPYILERSLENKIIPCVQGLRRILGTYENVLKAIKVCQCILECNVEKVVQPYISMLISHGVPESFVLKMFLNHPRSLLVRSNRFSEIVSAVMNLGFDPNCAAFVVAIRVMAVMSKTRWEQKVEAYKSFGLSNDEIYSAFKLKAMFMLVSENKIKKSMAFFVNKLKMKPLISKNPYLITLSLDKRIIPRCSVLQLLLSKGFVMADSSLITVFSLSS